MKKNLLTLAVAGMLLTPQSMQAKVEHLLPRPQSVSLTEGSTLALSGAFSINDPTDCVALRTFFTQAGCTLGDGGVPVTVSIVESISGAYDYTLHGFENEAYTLQVTATGINITAITPTGVVRAAQTLTQLAEGYDGAAALEQVNITDWPAFKLRGFMHDVGRSFVTVEELKKHIDLLSRFKVNCFHWHLTENQAWRMEIKAHGALTSAASMTRFAGQYYTQEQCSEVVAYAKERGVVVIPEIDMPGHSAAFERAMGFDMQTDEGVQVLKDVLDEVAVVFADAPYIHIGADEKTITYPNFLKIMTDYVHAKGKKVVVWNPIKGVNVASTESDMTQMWSSSGSIIDGRPNIDCRYNYTNHFDVFADVVGIYKSNIYYTDKGNANVAGTISCPWNDRKTPTQEDIVVQNNMYANVLASAERAWIGGGEQYIEKGGTTLPSSGAEYEAFVDWERRFLFHKANSLRNEPIPYVKQTNVRWRITDPFPNGGNAEAVFAPEAQGTAAGTGMMDESFTYEGETYGTAMATGAGIYLRHTWGNNTIPTFYGNNNYSNVTSYAWTYVYSPEEQTVGAQIEFQNYGRSENDKAPDAGKWDRKGSNIWINGERIAPPVWDNSGKGINSEVDLGNENFTARTPIRVKLNKGWNKVFLKLPYVSADGVRLNKWMFTCVFTDLEGKNAVEGLIYSPSQSMDEQTEAVAAEVSNIKRNMNQYIGTAVGLWPESTAAELKDKIAEIEATYQTSMDKEARDQQIAQLQAMWATFLSSLTAANINQPQEGKYYRLHTPLRGNRYPTSAGIGQPLQGATAHDTNASVWKFVLREDGSYDIQNFHNLSYISPASNNNTALNTVGAQPSAGWTVKAADTKGYVILVSGSVQFNQTNNSGQGYHVYNWGGGTNTSDTGCQYLVEEVEVDPSEEGAGAPSNDNLPFRTTTIVDGQFAPGTVWYTMQIGTTQHIISDNGTADHIALQTTQTQLDDADLWCFVGNAENGYKIYNKQAGPTKILASSTEMKAVANYGGTGGGTYPTMKDANALPSGYVGTWDLAASTKLEDVDGYFLFLHGTTKAMNNFGGINKLAFWAEGQDAGSTVSFTFAEATLEIKQSTGAFTVSNAGGTWHSKWESNQYPGLSLTLNANNMIATDGYLSVFSGQTGTCNHTLAAPEGCVIAGYSFDFKKATTEPYTINLSVAGSSYIVADVVQSVVVSDLKERNASFTQTGANKGVIYSNYWVTIRRSTVEPLKTVMVFLTTGQTVPYRIPAIAQARNGNVIAVADYRYSKADIGMAANGKLDLHFSISRDRGETWGNVETLVAGQGAAALAGKDDPNQMWVAFGDPCIVADRESDEVLVMSCAGNVSFPSGTRDKHQFIVTMRSNDNGETWGEPVDVAEQIYTQLDASKVGTPRAMFVGSGKISQSKTIKVGSYYRIYCAVLMKDVAGVNKNYALYSDDFGRNWTVLGSVDVPPVPSGGDEPKADELPDGSVLLSSRVNGGRYFNVFHYTDVLKGEGTWDNCTFSGSNNNGTASPGYTCNGEILTLPVTRKSDNKKMYLQLQSVPFGNGRQNLGIYYKELETLADFCGGDSIAKDWDGRFQVSYTTSCYSTMTLLDNNTVGFLYEENSTNGGYDILYTNLSVEQITDSAYAYCTDVVASDVVKAGIDSRRIEAGEGKYVGEYLPEAAVAVDAAIDAYVAAPSIDLYLAVNKALAEAECIEVEAGQVYRLRNANRQNGTLYITPADTKFSVATSNVSNANQLFTFAPTATEGEYYLYSPNYNLYLGKLGANETEPAVTANADEAGTWQVQSLTDGTSGLANTNKTGSNAGLHLAGDNTRLVPWTVMGGASMWYIEVVDELPVSIPDAGYAAVNLPVAFSVPEGMVAYGVTEPTVVDGVTCLYIEPLALVEGRVPANTPTILAAEAGEYALAVGEVAVPAVPGGVDGLCGTLRSATVDGAHYRLDGDRFVQHEEAGSVAANTAYYVSAALGEEQLPLSLVRGDVVVGIDEVQGQGGEAVFYDLSGRRVLEPKHGIYVLNGRTVLVP